MTIFAIGDIHGHYNEFTDLLGTITNEAGFNLDEPTSHLVLLGDYVDSGPDSKKVVETIHELKANWPTNVHPLKGNHDEMMVDALLHGGKKYDPDWWKNAYGKPTLESYGGEVPKEHLEFLDSLPYSFSTEKYFFAHAGVPPVSLREIETELAKEKPDPQLLEHLIWIRGDFYNSGFQWEKKIIFAHTPFDNPKTKKYEPYVRDTMIGINTLPRNEGKLTCIKLPEETFFFQEKLD